MPRKVLKIYHLAMLLALLLMFSSGCSLLYKADISGDVSSETISATGSVLESMPEHVRESFANYESNNWRSKSDKTEGTHDDSKFQNRDGDLPVKDDKGQKIEYWEHDVNNKKEGQGRDAERFVSGSDGSVYYTDDHYETFTRLK